MHIGLKGSSGCSATAMNALIIGSERGTFPEAIPELEARFSEPISIMARISLMTCSFSTTYLLSRERALRGMSD